MRPPEDWKRARVTLAIAAVTAVSWLVGAVFNLSEVLPVWGGFIPARVGGMAGDEILAPALVTPLTATLVHANFVHLAFNLIIHLFCGRAVENLLGGTAIIILYVVGAFAAAAVHYQVDPTDLVPMVGASGAISAILGAYALLFGRNKVRVANPVLALWLNALWLAVAWIALQLLLGFTFTSGGIRIAIAAHIGGFLAGLALTKPLLLFRYRKA